MANIAKKAIIQATIEGVLTDLMPKTTAEHVMVDETTTLATKLAAILADVAALPTTTTVNNAISALRTELMGEGVPEAYDTFKELADYINTHQSAADALTAAVGDKADKTAVEAIQTVIDGLGALATKSTVEETDLSAALKEKINAAAEGNHSHSNKTVLDGITAEKVTAWDGKATLYVGATAPADMGASDLFFKIVE